MKSILKKFLPLIILIALSLPALCSAAALVDPINTPLPDDPAQAIPAIISIALQIALGSIGALTIFMFIYGGFLMLTSAGKKEAYEKGKNTLVWAIIGFIVVIASYAVLSYIIAVITNP